MPPQRSLGLWPQIERNMFPLSFRSGLPLGPAGTTAIPPPQDVRLSVPYKITRIITGTGATTNPHTWTLRMDRSLLITTFACTHHLSRAPHPPKNTHTHTHTEKERGDYLVLGLDLHWGISADRPVQGRRWKCRAPLGHLGSKAAPIVRRVHPQSSVHLWPQ